MVNTMARGKRGLAHGPTAKVIESAALKVARPEFEGLC